MGTVAFLDRAAILGAADTTYETVEVPEWGGSVRVKSLTAAERDKFETDSIVESGKGKRKTIDVNMRNMRARLVVRCVVDKDGKRVFSDTDAEVLGDKNAAIVTRIYEVASRLAGLSEADMEELAGNSETGPSAGSTSD